MDAYGGVGQMKSTRRKRAGNPSAAEARRQPRLRTPAEALRVLRLIKETTRAQTTLGKISSQWDTTPFRVLISTMLSARTRDPVTEAASNRLFERFPDATALAGAESAEVAQLVKPVNYYNTKTQRIIQVAKTISEKFGGRVPTTLAELMDLPGVGRKTANCVLVYAFETPAIPVDVHVHRISNRVGLVQSKTPEETEEKLSQLYDRKYWLEVNELFVSFGQTVCKPTVPRCLICSVRPLCNYFQFGAKQGKLPCSS